jgi:hypothetical protein
MRKENELREKRLSIPARLSIKNISEKFKRNTAEQKAG